MLRTEAFRQSYDCLLLATDVSPGAGFMNRR